MANIPTFTPTNVGFELKTFGRTEETLLSIHLGSIKVARALNGHSEKYNN